jgi:hypothetical protein
MEEKVVRKTTVRRTTRKSVTPKSATTPRVSAVKKTADVSPVRKAPTRVSVAPSVPSTHKGGHRKLKVVSIGVFLFAVLFGVSALIGISDKGQLDVSGAIAERKQNASGEEKQALETVPTQQTQAAPNGGLVGMGAPEPVPVPEPTASTTEETASSTEASGEQTESESSTPTEETESTDPQATETVSTDTVEA